MFFFKAFQPKDKRGHCIKELIDTEKNYVEALNMLQQVKKFITVGAYVAQKLLRNYRNLQIR